MPAPMRLNDPDAYRTAEEADLIAELTDLRGQRVLELGCGAGWMTRLLAERFDPSEVVATEVDRVALDRNRGADNPPQVAFRYGGAEAIDAADAYFDAVFMFKSLHHVPPELMDRALREIHRVLRPGGVAWFTEPVYWGEFNDLMRLVHDEREVREAAFAALTRAVDADLFALERELFFQSPGTYETWDAFAGRFLDVTHTDLALTAERREAIRAAFERHMTPTGAHFLKPHRIDLLRRR